jgi:SAM-dependent methyltransferase
MALLQVAATRAQIEVEVRDWRGAGTLADLAERFDAVVCHDFLCALDEKASGEALAAAGAALRPGGRLVWVEPDEDACRVSALVRKEWKRAMPRAIINTDAEDGLDLGVATRPPEPVARRDGQPRGDAGKGKGKGFAAK